MDLSAVGLSGQVTISQVCAAIQDGWSFAAWNDTSLETCLSDAPDTYTLITIYRAAAPYVVCRAVRISDGMEYVGTWNPDREPNWTGWRQYATATPPQEYDLPLLDGWTNIDRSTYFKTQENVVVLTLSAQYISGVITGESCVATLPEGYRPTKTIPALCGISATGTETGYIKVDASGNVFFGADGQGINKVFAQILFIGS